MICAILKSEYDLPQYKTPGSAGFDLCNRSGSDIMIPPGCMVKVPTGITLALPEGTVGLLVPRSGKSFTDVGFSLANSPGIIDEDYREEIGALACNYGNEPIRILKNERMCQLVVVPYLRCKIVEVDSLDETDRKGGFGHTGRL